MEAETVISPGVSVVIPCYNAEQWIARAIGSALDQDPPPSQVIVIDDGSTDGSLAAIRSFGDRITWRTGPNRGGNHARNRGLALVETIHVAFLDADDLYEGPILAGSMAVAQADCADLVLSRMKICYPDGSVKCRGPFGPPDWTRHRIFEEWLVGLAVNPSSMLWRTPFLREIGGWAEDISINQDSELVLRALARGARIACNHAGFGIYNVGSPDSVSSNFRSSKKILAQFETLRRVRKEAEQYGFGDSLGGVDRMLYNVARWGFQIGDPSLARDALAERHGISRRRHYGPWRHRLLASLLGLEMKTRLTGR